MPIPQRTKIGKGTSTLNEVPKTFSSHIPRGQVRDFGGLGLRHADLLSRQPFSHSELLQAPTQYWFCNLALPVGLARPSQVTTATASLSIPKSPKSPTAMCFSVTDVEYEAGPVPRRVLVDQSRHRRSSSRRHRNRRIVYQYVWNGQVWVLHQKASFSSFYLPLAARRGSQRQTSSHLWASGSLTPLASLTKYWRIPTKS